jgi:hypothetical protein
VKVLVPVLLILSKDPVANVRINVCKTSKIVGSALKEKVFFKDLNFLGCVKENDLTIVG